MATTLYHWRNGAPFEGSSGNFSDVTDPATGEVSVRQRDKALGLVAKHFGSDAEAALTSSKINANDDKG